MRLLRHLLAALIALGAQLSMALPQAFAVEPTAPVLLVATPGRIGLFERAVILVLPERNGENLGFVLNHPTETSLAQLFPGYPAAQRVRSPLFNGGPHVRDSIYALFRSPQPPAESSVQVLPGLYVAFGDED